MAPRTSCRAPASTPCIWPWCTTGAPVLGVVLLPEMEELWIGCDRCRWQRRAWRENRAGEQLPPSLSSRRELGDLVLVASRNHRDQRLEQLLEALALGDTKAIGSVGGKVATILRGETDLYISLSGKSAPKDWDMAAPEAVLRAAGGAFTHADGQPLSYNDGDVRQAGCLIASHGRQPRRAVRAGRGSDGRDRPGFRGLRPGLAESRSQRKAGPQGRR